MATSGPLFPTTGADDATVGTAAWTNPANITADDGVVATVALGNTVTSHYIKGTGFNFAIPTGATINGITVEVKAHNAEAAGNGDKDSSIKLIKAGTIAGTDKSTGTIWGSNTPLAYRTYGSASDLWGQTWTPADINAANFGAAISAIDNANITGSNFHIDAMRITITYTPTTGAPTKNLLGVGT